jgi:uncharacterized protein (DUF927 family)
MIEAFVKEATPPDADGQVQRAAKRFALVGVAGELARLWDVVPWAEGAALDGARALYSDWVAARGGTASAESETQIAQVRRFIEQHGESRFDPTPAEPDTRPVHNRAGWRRHHEEDREWLVLPEVFKTEICRGLDPRATARLLAERGMLRRDENGHKLQRNERTPLWGQARLRSDHSDPAGGLRCALKHATASLLWLAVLHVEQVLQV